jgi:hypothetical protein
MYNDRSLSHAQLVPASTNNFSQEVQSPTADTRQWGFAPRWTGGSGHPGPHQGVHKGIKGRKGVPQQRLGRQK